MHMRQTLRLIQLLQDQIELKLTILAELLLTVWDWRSL